MIDGPSSRPTPLIQNYAHQSDHYHRIYRLFAIVFKPRLPNSFGLLHRSVVNFLLPFPPNLGADLPLPAINLLVSSKEVEESTDSRRSLG